MPEPLSLLVLALALATGLVAAIVVSQHVQTGRAGFVRYSLTNILLFNLLILSGLFFGFLQASFEARRELLAIVLPVVLALMAALKLGWLYAFTLTTRLMANNRFPNTLARRLTRAGIGLLAAYLVVLVLSRSLGREFWLQAVGVALECVVIGGAAIAAAGVVAYASRLPKANRRRSLMLFGTFHLGLFAVILAVQVAGWLQPGPQRLIQLLANGGFLALFNLFPSIWIARFSRHPETGPDDRFESLGITRREQEIIELIKAGKPNQEIADLLFISVATVKDHNRNLFRKCGVRNRLELSNLFR